MKEEYSMVEGWLLRLLGELAQVGREAVGHLRETAGVLAAWALWAYRLWAGTLLPQAMAWGWEALRASHGWILPRLHSGRAGRAPQRALALALALCMAVSLLPAEALAAGGEQRACGHVHDGACYARELNCGQEESEGHVHTDACYTDQPVCGLEEGGDHTHGETCFTDQPVCGQEESEGHAHTDACYTDVLDCPHVCDETCGGLSAPEWEETLPASAGEAELAEGEPRIFWVTASGYDLADPTGYGLHKQLSLYSQYGKDPRYGSTEQDFQPDPTDVFCLLLDITMANSTTGADPYRVYGAYPVTLDLNGWDLSQQAQDHKGVFRVGGELTLIDSQGARYVDESSHTGIGTVFGGRMDFGAYTGITDSAKILLGGGGVCVEPGGTFTLTAGEITNNQSATGLGGGVYVAGLGTEAAVCNMEGGKVTGNRAHNPSLSNTMPDAGGGVLVDGENAVLNLSGQVVISGNTVGQIVSADGRVTEGDASYPNNLTTLNGGQIHLVGALESGSDIGLTPPADGTELVIQGKGHTITETDASYFHSDHADYTVTLDKDQNRIVLTQDPATVPVATVDGTEYTSFAAAWTAFDRASQKTTLTLLRDVTGTAYADAADPATGCLTYQGNGRTATLDLNGHSIDRGLTQATDSGEVLRVTGMGQMVITDTSTAAHGALTGGWTTGNGGGIHVAVSDGKIPSLVIAGGVITGNRAEQNGGGVALEQTATSSTYLSISGGTITGNTAGKNGGGVYVAPRPKEITDATMYTLRLQDCTITGNHAGEEGGGVYAAPPAIQLGGTVKVQGNTKGTENKPSDCYADWTDLSLWGDQSGSTCVAYLTGGNAEMDPTLAALSEDSRVGVDCGLPVSKTGFEVGWQGEGFVDNDARIFLSSTQAYQRLLESENSRRVHFEYTAPVPLEEGVTPQRGKTYTIANETQLHRLAVIVNGGNACEGATFQLLNEIHLSEYAAWTPIGTYDELNSNQSCPFNGVFEGGNCTVSGFAIDQASANSQGLFGNVGASGKVKDLTVAGSVTGQDNVGGVAGYSAGTVEHCVNRAAVSGRGLVGGLVGRIEGGKVTGCTNEGAVTGTGGCVGGVVGQADKESPALPGLVENCANTAAVTGGDQTGGVVGSNSLSSTVRACVNSGTVIGTAAGYGVGGVAGRSSGTVENCFNSGPVTGRVNESGENLVGGVVGGNADSVVGCGNTGKVTAEGGNTQGHSYAGGVVGTVAYASDTVKNCYNTGAVSGAYNGGVAGKNVGTVQNCYNTGMVGPAVGNQMTCAGGIAAANTGTVEHCVSLGAVVGVGQGGSRIAPDGTLTDNYARADMIVKDKAVTSADANRADGADLTTGEAQAWDTWFDSATAGGVWESFPTAALTQGAALPTLAALPEGVAQAPTLPGVPTKLSLDQTSLTLYANPEGVKDVTVPQTATLKAALDMDGAEVTWTSSDESIAAVDQNGVVTAAVSAEAAKGGKATITATCFGLKATCEVTVYKVREAAIQDLAENPQNNTYMAYPIRVEKDLLRVRTLQTSSLTYAGTAFLLMNDLSLTSGGDYSFLTGTNIPIGTSSAPFKGTFEGQGHTIRNLVIKAPNASHQGLFGYCVGATIRDLTVEGSVTGKSYVGGIVGTNLQGRIENCVNRATVSGSSTSSSSQGYIGGVVGNITSGVVADCRNEGAVTYSFENKTTSNLSFDGIGGVAGDAGSVLRCANRGAVTLTVTGTGKAKITGAVGGVIGETSGAVEDCINTAAVTGPSTMGGVAGLARSVRRCANTGPVTGTPDREADAEVVGGVVGESTVRVENCYNTGAVSGAYYGGVLGKGKAAVNCYNAGMIDCTVSVESAGGIAEQCDTVQNCVSLGNSFNRYSSFKRIAANKLAAGDVALSDNYARADLRVEGNLVTDGALDNDRGLNLALGAAQTWDTWFDPAVAGDAWEFPGGTLDTGAALPTLKGLPREAQSPTLAPIAGRISIGPQDPMICGLGADHAVQLTADLDVQGAPVRWEVDAPATLTVDEQGKATGVKAGFAYVTAYTGSVESNQLKVYVYDNVVDMPTEGDLQKKYVYQIKTEEQLRYLAQVCGKAGSPATENVFLLMNDIALTGEWTPIGDSSKNTFHSVFDGQGHTISGLSIDNSQDNYQGLFGYCSGAKIRNLVVEGSVKGDTQVGGLAGALDGSCTVDNCASLVDVTAAGNFAGGLVGLYSGAVLRNCYAAGTVTATGSYAGGLVGGSTSGSLQAQNCYATGAVTAGGDHAGGLVGRVYGSENSLEHCVALNPSVTTGTGTHAGRVTGEYRASTGRNNRARADLSLTVAGVQTPVTNGTLDDLNGENILPGAVQDWESWFADTSRWKLPAADTPLLPGKDLPVLFGERAPSLVGQECAVTFYDGSTPYGPESGWPPLTVTGGDHIQQPEGTPAKPHFTFNGWVTEPGGSTAFDFDAPIVGNTNIYASWTGDPFTVTFDAQGGTPAPETRTVRYGDAYGTLPAPTRPGYGLDGWYTAATGGTQVTESTVYQPDGPKNHTLYARWTPIAAAKPALSGRDPAAVTYGYQAAPEMTVAVTDPDSETYSYTYAWYAGASASGGELGTEAGFTAPADLDAGSHKYTVRVTAARKDNGERAYTDKTFTVTVEKAPLTVALSEAVPQSITKTYDGTLSVADTAGWLTVTGMVGDETVTATGTWTYADKHVGTGKTITGTGFRSTYGNGAKADNYTTAPDILTTTGSITAKALTVTAAVEGPVTYGTDVAPTLTSDGLAGGDRLTGEVAIQTSESGEHTLSNGGKLPVGGYKAAQGTLTVDDGNGGGNYVLTFDGGTFTVEQRTLSHDVAPVKEKEYDGTTAAAFTGGLTNTVADDAVALDAAFAYDSPSVGTGKTITAATWQLTGADAGNYSLPDAPKVTDGEITTVKAEVVWTGLDGTYTYNGKDQSGSITATTKLGEEDVALVVTFTGPGDRFQNAGGYTVTASFPEGTGGDYALKHEVQSLTMAKQTVTAPTIESRPYTGRLQTAEVAASELYDITDLGGTEAGDYDVVLTLTDPLNYKWTDSGEAAKPLTFTITRADNQWSTTLSCGDITYGDDPAPAAAAKFGNVVFTYSAEKDGTYAPALPDQTGTLWVKAEVAGTGSYTGLTDTASFQVNARILTAGDVTVSGVKASYPYTGQPIQPEVTEVKWGEKTLRPGTDYEVSYGIANTEAGTNTGKVYIGLKGGYAGSDRITLSFSILNDPWSSVVGGDLSKVLDHDLDRWLNKDTQLKGTGGWTISDDPGFSRDYALLVQEGGAQTVTVYAKHDADHPGKVYYAELTYKLDKTKPVITVDEVVESWAKERDYTFTVIDALSGVNYLSISAEGEGPTPLDVKPDGTYTVTLKANSIYTITVNDKAGNEDSTPIIVRLIDTTKPTVEVTGIVAEKQGLNGWSTGKVTVHVSIKDKETPLDLPATGVIDWSDRSGIKSWAYSLDGGKEWKPMAVPNGDDQTTSFPIDQDRDYTGLVLIRATDNAGNTSDVVTADPIKLDQATPAAPSVTAKAGAEDYLSGNWTHGTVTFGLSGTATTSGTAKYQYAADGGHDWHDVPQGGLTHSANTSDQGVTYRFRAVNGAGTEGEESSFVVKVRHLDEDEVLDHPDNKYAEGDIKIGAEGVKDGWYTEDVTVTVDKKTTITGGGASYPADTWYQEAGQDPARRLEGDTDTIPISGDGIHILEIWTQDAAGNETTHLTVTIQIDGTRPTVTDVTGNPTAWQKTDVTLTVQGAADATSGLAKLPYSFDGGISWQAEPSKTYAAIATAAIRVRDVAGNIYIHPDVSISKIDKEAPKVAWDAATAALDSTKWYGATTVRATVTDNSGETIAAVYTANGLNKPNGLVDTNGVFTVAATATDPAGNTAKVELVLRIETKIDDFVDMVGGLNDGSGYQAVLDAKTWYDSQSDAVKDRFSKNDGAQAALDKLKDLLERKAGEAAAGVTGSIQEADTLDEIRQAGKDYDALPDGAKDKISDEVKQELEEKRKDAEAAQKVVDQLTSADRAGASYEEKQAAQAAYGDLTEDQKKLVDQIEEAVGHKDQIDTDLAAIGGVLDRLDAIQKPYSPGTKDQIRAAKDAYDSLTPKQQAAFPKEEQARLDGLETMREHAQAVEDAIRTALNGTPTLEELSGVKAQHSALTEDEKAMVDGTLKDSLEDRYQEELGKLTADEKAAAQFATQVEEAKKAPTVDKIEQLIRDHDALTPEAQGHLSKQTKDDYQALVDALEEARKVIDKMDGIDPGSLGPEDLADVKDALEDYDQLTPPADALVDQATGGKPGILADAVKEAEKAEEEIGKIPGHSPDASKPDGSPDLDGCKDPSNAGPGNTGTGGHDYEIHRKAIEEAKIAYEKLTDAGRRLVSQSAKERLEREYAALMDYLKYVNTAETPTTTVEVAGLAERVDLPEESAGAAKTVISVVMEDSRPQTMPPIPQGKTEMLSVDVKLVAKVYDDPDGPASTVEVQPKQDHPVLVKLKVPSGFRNDTLELWHVKDSGARSRIYDFWLVTEADGVYAVFEVGSFSHFVFLAEKVSGGGTGGGTGTVPGRPSVPDPDHGSVTVTPSQPKPGQTGTITPKPDEGYVVDEVIVTDKNGDRVPVIDNGDGTWSYTQPKTKVTITVTFKPAPPELPFTDVAENDWFFDNVCYVYGNGLMQGTAEDLFSPDEDTSRGMVVTILWRLAGRPQAGRGQTFPDVAQGQWYTDAVAWAAEAGIVKGYGDGTFGPGDPVTREQLAAILYRYARSEGGAAAGGSLSAFRDQPAPWAREAMEWAVGAGIITGKGDGVLDPGGRASRAETAAMLARLTGQ